MFFYEWFKRILVFEDVKSGYMMLRICCVRGSISPFLRSMFAQQIPHWILSLPVLTKEVIFMYLKKEYLPYLTWYLSEAYNVVRMATQTNQSLERLWKNMFHVSSAKMGYLVTSQVKISKNEPNRFINLSNCCSCQTSCTPTVGKSRRFAGQISAFIAHLNWFR